MGISIMDNYFEKLDTSKMSEDELDVHDEELAKYQSNSEDFVVYEAKDPYILRSLPYLIGSSLYLENDHIGLEENLSDEEDDSDYDEELKKIEANKETDDDEESETETDSDAESDADKPAHPAPSLNFAQPSKETKERKNVVKKSNMFSSSSEESGEENEDLFSSKKNNVKTLSFLRVSFCKREILLTIFFFY